MTGFPVVVVLMKCAKRKKEYIMKSMIRKIKAVSMALLMALVLSVIAMPVSNANAEPVSESVTNEPRIIELVNLSGDLKPGQSKAKSFNVSSPAGAAIKVVYTSFSQNGNQYAPITVSIDGSTVATSDGFNTSFTIWNVTAGNHTLKVENTGSVWLAYAVTIVTI